MKIHELKTINPYFERCWLYQKTFEVRKNDRDFEVGDEVRLKEYDAENGKYSGRVICGKITYVLRDYDAVASGYVVFSFEADELLEAQK